MKKWRFSFLIAALLMTVSAFAQNQNLVGHVTDENGEAMPFVNVVLLSLSDSTFVQGTVTDEQGAFDLPTDKREGLLKVSFVGYQTQYAKATNGLTIQMTMDSQVLGTDASVPSAPRGLSHLYKINDRAFAAVRLFTS